MPATTKKRRPAKPCEPASAAAADLAIFLLPASSVATMMNIVLSVSQGENRHYAVNMAGLWIYARPGGMDCPPGQMQLRPSLPTESLVPGQNFENVAVLQYRR